MGFCINSMISVRQFGKSVMKLFRIMLVKFKPLTVHTEAIFYDDVWEIVKEKIKRKEIHTWYLMTPVNYYDIKAQFHLKESGSEIEKKIKARYLEMKANGEKLQLHIHLHPLMKDTYKEQETLIKNSIKWLRKNIGIEVSEIVFGWFRYNEDSEKIAKKYGLKIIKFNDFNSTHDFDWVLNCEGECKI